MIKRASLAVCIGTLVTLLLLGAAFVADFAGLESLARALFWQNTLAQSFVSMGNIGMAEHPVYEGSPLNFIAFLASLPIGVAVYGTVAFVLMDRFMRKR
jgi:protein-S-isoprenylcysteine O-methyltransferase Ste14